MRKFFISILLFVVSNNIFAQNNSNKFQDDNTSYTKHEKWSQQEADISNGNSYKIKEFYEANKHKIPTEQELKNMKHNTNLPKNINDILYEYDWISVASYAFNYDPQEEGYTIDDFQFKLRRHHTKKGLLEFNYFQRSIGTMVSFESYSNYDSKNNTYWLQKIAKVGTHFYYTDSHKKPTYYPIVDYKNGFVIIDVTQSGKLGDLKCAVRFRIVYMLVPKYF